MDDESAILPMDDHETRSPSRSCRPRLLFLAKVLLHLGCLGYSLYLIWLLAYLKDNPYYWFLSYFPFSINILALCFDLLFMLMVIDDDDSPAVWSWRAPSLSVVYILMTCFTMLTRLAYYHRQPDEFIGPRFIIFSLQGSIILILLDFCLQREGKLESLLNCKDALSRMLLDFLDIFNMIEILSANKCVGLGSFISEESSTEKAIQAFCTLSFIIFFCALDLLRGINADEETDNANNEELHEREKFLFALVFAGSIIFQNLPFLVIRIVVWARYGFYNVGFLVKNVFAIIFHFMYICTNFASLRLFLLSLLERFSSMRGLLCPSMRKRTQSANTSELENTYELTCR